MGWCVRCSNKLTELLYGHLVYYRKCCNEFISSNPTNSRPNLYTHKVCNLSFAFGPGPPSKCAGESGV